MAPLILLTILREFMESPRITDPPETAAIMEEMRQEQEALNGERLQLIEQLRSEFMLQSVLSKLQFIFSCLNKIVCVCVCAVCVCLLIYCILFVFCACVFRDMRPPSSTKTAIYQWNQRVVDISKELGEEWTSSLFTPCAKLFLHRYLTTGHTFFHIRFAEPGILHQAVHWVWESLPRVSVRGGESADWPRGKGRVLW